MNSFLKLEKKLKFSLSNNIFYLLMSYKVEIKQKTF